MPFLEKIFFIFFVWKYVYAFYFYSPSFLFKDLHGIETVAKMLNDCYVARHLGIKEYKTKIHRLKKNSFLEKNPFSIYQKKAF